MAFLNKHAHIKDVQETKAEGMECTPSIGECGSGLVCFPNKLKKFVCTLTSNAEDVLHVCNPFI